MPVAGEDHRRFLLRVLPWPVDDEPGFINLHWKSAEDSRGGAPGKPTRDVDKLINLADFLANKSGRNDLYFCLSRQARSGVNTHNKPKAIRNQSDALALKAIWIDVDVKTPPKGYASLKEALAAVTQFCTDTGMPAPSALVASGGGLHVYWISKRALTPDEWKPYAHGLKNLAIEHGLRCDAGVTIDSVRLLRVPGTWNHKTVPPRPVKMLLLHNDYDFADLAFLKDVAGSLPSVSTAVFDPAKFPKLPIPAGGIESLSLGLEREELPPLDPKPILKGCRFLMDALRTGGKDYSQPMWNLTTLAATFMENGNVLAHRMGRSHPGYSVESTEALWDRKTRERTERGLGWPSCNAIQAAGCVACATCPHWAKGKSPLNLALAPKVTAAVTPFIPTAASSGPLLPDGYVFNERGYVCKEIETFDKKTKEAETLVLPILQCQVSGAWAEGGTRRALNFTCSADKGNFVPVRVPYDKMTATEITRCLHSQGCVTVPRNGQYLLDFIMAWITKIQEAQEAQKARPFGWYKPKATVEGFGFGGLIIRTKGNELPSGFSDPKFKEWYTPTGDLSKWMDACRLITDQHRPEVACIVAASFAAPLVHFTGYNGTMLSVWGNDTGAGKTSSHTVGATVWGHPKFSCATTDSTQISVMEHMGVIQNLPMFWDEITETAHQKTVFQAMFAGAQGVEKGRSTQSGGARDRGIWQTMTIACSNLSLADYVAARQPNTEAGLMRMFEYKCHKPPEGYRGQIDKVDAQAIFAACTDNYGMMGMQYARLLASDPAGHDKLTKGTMRDVIKAVNQEQQERFWPATVAALVVGAQLANKLGCGFDIPEMYDFLIQKYFEMRARVKAANTDGSTIENTQSYVNAFFNEFFDSIVWTDAFNTGRGKAAAVTPLHLPREGVPALIHFSVGDRTVRFNKLAFADFLKTKEVSLSSVMNNLHSVHGATVLRATIGAGTPRHAMQDYAVSIPIPVGSEYESMMLMYTDPSNMGAAAAQSGATGTTP